MDILETLKKRNPTEPLALTAQGYLCVQSFLSAVARWNHFFKHNHIDSAVLFCSNRIRFSAALLGAWCAHVKTILPTDLTVKTKDKLEKEGAFFLLDETPDPLECKEADQKTLCLAMNEALVELFTSGSTGEPTRVTKTLGQVLADVDTLDADFPIRPLKASAIFSTVSHQHIYGFLWAVLWPIASHKIITEKRLLFPENIKTALERSSHAVLISSPAHLKRLPLDLDWTESRAHLTHLVSSGGPLSEEALKLCRQAFHRTPFEILGSTELDGIAWRQRRFLPDDTIDPASCLWKAMPGTEIGINPDGIIQVKSERLDPQHWTVGNDKIVMRPDGLFTLLGRTDRIVKIEEKRLSLTALEKSLLASGFFAEAKAFLMPEKRDLSVVAVPSEKGQALLIQSKLSLIRAAEHHLREEFEAVLLPHRWRFEPIMPTNSQGKYTIEALQSLFDRRHIEPSLAKVEHHSMRLQFKVDERLPFFEGHFPQWPILPGVAQVHLVIEEAHRYLKTPRKVDRISNLKFMSIIKPKTTLLLTCLFDSESMKMKFSLTSADRSTRYSCGTMHFATDKKDDD